MPPCPEVAARPSSIELCGWPWWSVHHGPRHTLVHEPWTESMLFTLKKQILAENSIQFCKEAPILVGNQAVVHDFNYRALESENNSRLALATFQKVQIGPYNFVSSYLCNRHLEFSDSCAKILGIFHSFILCIHLTHVYCNYLLLCLFVLGNVVSEPFREDL
jgi:hypothetical protein